LFPVGTLDSFTYVVHGKHAEEIDVEADQAVVLRVTKVPAEQRRLSVPTRSLETGVASLPGALPKLVGFGISINQVLRGYRLLINEGIRHRCLG